MSALTLTREDLTGAGLDPDACVTPRPESPDEFVATDVHAGEAALAPAWAAAARRREWPFLPLEDWAPPAEATGVLDGRVARRRQALPVAADPAQGAVTLAVADLDAAGQDPELRGALRGFARIDLVAATPSVLARRIAEAYPGLTAPVEDPVALADEILEQAAREGASDVRIEPDGVSGVTRVRYQLGGQARVVAELPFDLGEQLAAQIKMRSRPAMHLDEQRLPQKGQLPVPGAPGVVGRASTLPTVDGEQAVIRILESESRFRTLDDMGLSARARALVERALSVPNGLLLVVGPMGSGKSTFSKAMLTHGLSERVTAVSVEDPVEARLRGVAQVSVNPAVGLTFDLVVETLTRQAVDRIMVGEIGNEATARATVRAAQIGRRVIATVHAESAIDTVARLAELGVPRGQIGRLLRIVVSQRLVRALCPQCATRRPVTGPELVRVGLPVPAGPLPEVGAPVGCPACDGEGYSTERIPVHEVLLITPRLAALISRGEPVEALEAEAIREGLTSLVQDGWAKVLVGQTSMAQLATLTWDHTPIDGLDDTLGAAQ